MTLLLEYCHLTTGIPGCSFLAFESLRAGVVRGAGKWLSEQKIPSQEGLTHLRPHGRPSGSAQQDRCFRFFATCLRLPAGAAVQFRRRPFRQLFFRVLCA